MLLFEEMELQIKSIEPLKNVSENKNMEQRCKKEIAGKWVLASAVEKLQQYFDSNHEKDDSTPRGSIRHRLFDSLIEIDNRLKAASSSIEKCEAARRILERRSSEFEWRVYMKLLPEQENEQTKRREADECWEQRVADRLRVLVKLFIKAIVWDKDEKRFANL